MKSATLTAKPQYNKPVNRSIIRRKKQLHRRVAIFAFTVVLVAILSITVGMTFAKAQTPDEVTYKYYKSYMVEQNDSLWTLAEANCIDTTEEAIQDYIYEVKKMNSLDETGTIFYGSYLVLPYYSYEFH